MRTLFISLLLSGLSSMTMINSANLFIEAESFTKKGGWVVDQQFMDLMGSSYLMAHGMGEPVEDAQTEVTFPEKGTYYVYVRTYNWTSPWKDGEGPGKFSLYVGNKKLASPLGCEGNAWMWQAAGKVTIKDVNTELRLHDLTGFNGRCDAIYFTTEEDAVPPSDVASLEKFRREKLNLPAEAPLAGEYDLVVVGAGIAGMSAAVSAARLGCKVALLNDRPVIGGNNSSEIRVHLGGRIEAGPYKELGNLQKEFGPTRGGNAQPADYYEDQKKMDWLLKEKNVSLFTNYRAIAVEKEGNRITAVIAKHIETGEEKRFEAPLFSDCTGDGTIGYLAGADYRMGRESRDEFGESTAPEQADKMTMGASVQWYSEDTKKPSSFPHFEYGVDFNEKNCEKVTMGEWTWETGMNYDQIKDFERIRDYGLLVVYSNWSYLKNEMKENDVYKNRKLAWVAYISGKRESRRLMGDYILKEDDLRKHVVHEDGSAASTWSIDLHYPDPKNTENFPGQEFKSIAKHINIYPYPIPYRCLYSRNIDNLFMAGRNISVTHVALGTVRVMRTTGMMGEVVGMAASICKKYQVNPRGVYQYHLPELKELMKEGVGQKGLPNNQRYNEGGTLKEEPVVR
ncbi:FAD-dependent oxidoreductase [Parabacteroides sp. AD58]|uniref:FAD-dependent oxidoreductase n=2 Tax=Parabacteroides absconsus TaxID=2951805 RepID=A0ABZ2IJN3_9BACT|nr:FAD-dependent oxidoreductase [Parabacteroides sp. AD58]MCM6902151.1 FAD-dependent oxidoreductase [Parabacteroides sp. AD58]